MTATFLGMGLPDLGVLMLILFIGLILLGFPIGFTLMAMGVGFGYLGYHLKEGRGELVFTLLSQKTFQVMSSDVLISVPLFVFMGYIIERANILDRLFRSIQHALQWLPGSLAIATLATCAVFATATGIVGAVVTLMGLLAYPAMLRAGYDPKLSAGVVCAGGCLGILIPPSVMLILYGAVASESVPRLYAGAFLPGVMLAAMYMVYVLIRAVLNPKLAPKLPAAEREPMAAEKAVDFLIRGVAAAMGGLALYFLLRSQLAWQAHWLWMISGAVALLGFFFSVIGWRIALELLKSFFPLAVLVLAVLGAIFFGWSTPSEGAALGALGALVLAAAYRTLTFAKLKDSVFLTARTSAMVCWLFVGSFIYSAVFAYLGGQAAVEEFVKGLGLNPFTFMLLSQVIIFILGWPLEWTEIIVIFVPIFLPLLKVFNIDPLFFGIMIALNIQTSFLSPPVAMAPFYLKGVAPAHVSINQIFKGVMPFLWLVIVAMALLYIFPEIATWLPDELYGKKR
jgi:TRAP-type mannitol/chloroaromatic compound transport system permease large subunit